MTAFQPEFPTVLLVDDDEDFTRSLSRMLRNCGWRVMTTNRSFGVLNLMAEHRPHIVVLDVTMPGLDGVQLAELVRADPELGDTPMLLHSGMPEADLRDRAAAVGADGYVVKGDRPRDLLAALRQLGQRVDEPVRRLRA